MFENMGERLFHAVAGEAFGLGERTAAETALALSIERKGLKPVADCISVAMNPGNVKTAAGRDQEQLKESTARDRDRTGLHCAGNPCIFETSNKYW